MSQRPKLRPQDELQTRLATARHQQRVDEQLASFIMGAASKSPPTCQEEADEVSAALSLWVRLGADLHTQLWPVRQAWVEHVQSKGVVDAAAVVARVHDPLSDDPTHPGRPVGGLGNKVP